MYQSACSVAFARRIIENTGPLSCTLDTNHFLRLRCRQMVTEVAYFRKRRLHQNRLTRRLPHARQSVILLQPVISGMRFLGVRGQRFRLKLFNVVVRFA